MFLTGRRLDCCDDLTRHAELRKSAERRELVVAEVADGLVEADHALLDDVLAVGTDEEIRTRLGTDEVPVLVDQIIQCDLIVVFLDIQEDLFVRQILVSAVHVLHDIRVCCFFHRTFLLLL